MGKAIEGAAMIGLAVTGAALEFMDPALMLSPMYNKLLTSLLVGGISMEAGAIANALTQNRGMNITTRQPASFRQIIYGTQRIGGVIIYRSTTGGHHDQYNYIIVLATHEIAAIESLYLDGRLVHFESGSAGQTTSPDGTVFGGHADSNQYTGPNGQYYNFGTLVYCEARYGNQAEGDVIGGMTANDPTWAADSSGNSPWVGGCAYVYLKVEYDANMFPAEPEIRFTVRGKNDILDPRTGTTGYSDNWALIIADAITDPTWGLGDNSVNQAQLIAAANVCDEQVTLASGSTESRYCCHWHYDTSTSVGNAIETMMSAAAGRLSRIGGEWYIWPAYWQGPTLSFGIDDLAGGIEWQPNRPIAQLFNRVTGTYIAPNYPYNVAGNLYDSNGWYDGSIQNNFPFAFQPTNYPEYACDQLHGYGTGVDIYLTEDGGIELPKEIAQPCVLSVSQAQRLAKINLLRNRQQGTGVLPMALSALQVQPLDVIQFTFTAHGWADKQLEVIGFDWVVDRSQKDGVPRLLVQLKVGETDQSVYEWSTAEELTVYDVPAAPAGVPYIVAPVTNLAIEDDSTTVITLADGTTVPRLLVSWTPPEDVYVNNGGKIEVQYQYATSAGEPQPGILSPLLNTGNNTYSSGWVDAGALSGDATFLFINGITPLEYQNINVRVRAVRANGATSAWAEVDNHPLLIKYPIWPILDTGGSGPILTYGAGGPTVKSLQPAEAAADVTSAHTSADTAAVSGVASANVAQGATGLNTNLVTDSDFKFQYTYWSGYSSSLFDGISPDSGLPQVKLGPGSTNPFLLCYANESVTAGQTYTGSCYLDATNLTAGSLDLKLIWNTGGGQTVCSIPAGSKGRVSGTFTVPTGVTSIAKFQLEGNGVATTDYGYASGPMLQLGSVATAYQSNMMDNHTGYLVAGTASIDLSSSIHLNKTANYIAYTAGATVDSLKPAQAGADVTAQAGSVFLENPNFATGSLSGWTIGSGAPSVASGNGFQGSNYSLSCPSGTQVVNNNQTIPCAEGDVLSATAYFKGSSAVGTSATANVRIVFYDQSGNIVNYSDNATVSTWDGSWHQSRLVLTAGANTAYAQVSIVKWGTSSDNVYAGGVTASIHPRSLAEVPDGGGKYAANEPAPDYTTNHIADVQAPYPGSAVSGTSTTSGWLTIGTISFDIASAADAVSIRIYQPSVTGSAPLTKNMQLLINGTAYAMYGNLVGPYEVLLSGLAAGSYTASIQLYIQSSSGTFTYGANTGGAFIHHVADSSAGFITAPSNGGTLISKPTAY